MYLNTLNSVGDLIGLLSNIQFVNILSCGITTRYDSFGIVAFENDFFFRFSIIFVIYELTVTVVITCIFNIFFDQGNLEPRTKGRLLDYIKAP